MPRVGGAWLPARDPTRRIGINWGNDVANAHFGVRYLLPADILRCNHRVSGIIEDFYKCINCNGSFFLFIAVQSIITYSPKNTLWILIFIHLTYYLMIIVLIICIILSWLDSHNIKFRALVFSAVFYQINHIFFIASVCVKMFASEVCL